MAGSKALVSIIIVTYNSQEYLENCLQSVFKTDDSSFEVFVIDNGSTDRTLEIIKKFPQVRLIKSKKNLGYAGGNNLGVKEAKGKQVAILNPDTQVSPGWLKPLVRALKQPEVAVGQPKIMLAQEEKRINLIGKTTHYLGFDWLADYRKKDYQMSQQEIISFSGSAFLIKREVFQKIGGFDPDYFMYFEDSDLSWRLRLAGYRLLLVPESVVYHQYQYQPKEEYQQAQQKFYYLERNRLITLLKNYSWKTLFLLLPAIKLMEKGMIFYFLTRGWWWGKPKGYFWLLLNLPRILKKRQKVQKMRKWSDREMVKNFVGKIEFEEFDNFLLRNIANPVLGFYWRLVKGLI